MRKVTMLKWKLWQERKEGKKNGQIREEKIKRYVLEINCMNFESSLKKKKKKNRRTEKKKLLKS